jgi:outer membrane scaffolding protein for murein synthesis (MipA/OmpV family)
MRDMGGSFNAYINVGKRWSVNPYVSYRYIFDEYGDAPIVEQFGSRNQFIAGFHLMREFRFNWR